MKKLIAILLFLLPLLARATTPVLDARISGTSTVSGSFSILAGASISLNGLALNVSNTTNGNVLTLNATNSTLYLAPGGGGNIAWGNITGNFTDQVFAVGPALPKLLGYGGLGNGTFVSYNSTTIATNLQTWPGTTSIINLGNVTTGTFSANINNATIVNGSNITGNAVFLSTPTNGASGFVISQNSITNIAPLGAPSALVIIDSDAANFGVTNYAFHHSGGIFAGIRSEGTAAAPSNTTNGVTLAEFAGGGYGSTHWLGGQGAFKVRSDENFTDSSAATKLSFYVSKPGTIVYALVAEIGSLGDFRLAPFNQTQSSGGFAPMNLTSTWGQTGTASSTDFLINRIENSLGSGAAKFVDYQVSGTSRYSISNAGLVTMNAAASNSFLYVGAGNVVTGLAATNSSLFGRNGTGAFANITLGGNLSLTGNVLNSTGGGGVTPGANGTIYITNATGTTTFSNTIPGNYNFIGGQFVFNGTTPILIGYGSDHTTIYTAAISFNGNIAANTTSEVKFINAQVSDTTGNKQNVLYLQHLANDGSAALGFGRASDGAYMLNMGYSNPGTGAGFANETFIHASVPYPYNGSAVTGNVSSANLSIGTEFYVSSAQVIFDNIFINGANNTTEIRSRQASNGNIKVALMIANTGNIGMGSVTAPTAIVDIKPPYTSTGSQLLIESNVSTGQDTGFLAKNNNADLLVMSIYDGNTSMPFANGGNGTALFNTGAGGMMVGTIGASGDTRLVTGGSGSSNIRLDIQNTGNVSIGYGANVTDQGFKFSVNGTTNLTDNLTISSGKTINGQTVVISANIDAKTSGNTTIYTPNSGKNFTISSIAIENLAVTALTVPAQMTFSAGATTNDVTVGLTLTTAAAGQEFRPVFATQPFICTNGAPLTLRITVGATATTQTVRIVVTGIEYTP